MWPFKRGKGENIWRAVTALIMTSKFCLKRHFCPTVLLESKITSTDEAIKLHFFDEVKTGKISYLYFMHILLS